MDTFVEQIVVKKKGGKEWAIIAGILVAALILAALALLLGPFALLLIAGIGYGAYWLITSQNIEYEYSVTNGDIDIDPRSSPGVNASASFPSPARRSNPCSPISRRNMWAASLTGR